MKTWKQKYDEIFKANYFEFSFKIFHELMARRVKEILLVSSPYDAFILEEDGRFAERIIHEYRGLNLSHPPKLTWASSPSEAFDFLLKDDFDLVITMPRFDDVNPYRFCAGIKRMYPKLPVYLLAHMSNIQLLENNYPAKDDCFDKKLIWSGNSDLLLALVKSEEDMMNVSWDTKRAKVRVIIFVEDSPKYLSSLLPLLYKEVVLQTQAVMEESLNEEDRLLRMRARPKILLAENYEDAVSLYTKYKPYLLGVISDVRFKKDQKLNDKAGLIFHKFIKKNTPDTPVLLLSSDDSNRAEAFKLNAFFLNKNSQNLHSGIHSFLINHLAFGSFIFNYPDGKIIAKASTLREMEKLIPSIPDEVFKYHAERNHISTWLTARSEIFLASLIRPVSWDDFVDISELKNFISFCIHMRRKGHQRVVIADFNIENFDPETDFIKMGTGSLGGKARGLAFASHLLDTNLHVREKFPKLNIRIPKTLVIATEYFDHFMEDNQLDDIIDAELADYEIINRFINGKLHANLKINLTAYLKQVKHPIAVRSSSLLEDALYQPSAGLYRTYMLPNNNHNFSIRHNNLSKAIKLVFASTYLNAAKQLAKTTLRRTEEEKMAVIIQEAIGNNYGDYFFPAISGVVKSYNFYPMSYMKPEEGIAHIALGFGKTVVSGETSLRFSPKYPQNLPHFSKIKDILKTSQRSFYAINMKHPDKHKIPHDREKGHDISEFMLSKLDIEDHKSVISLYTELRNIFSSYIAQDHKIVDYFSNKHHCILSFADILKHDSLPLPEILSELLVTGRKGMGTPIEIEFVVNYIQSDDKSAKVQPEFLLLQIRPMSLQSFNSNVIISEEDIRKAFCYSTMSMGNGIIENIKNIVYVKKSSFDSSHTLTIADEITKINRNLTGQNIEYLLIGPGRWGSADRWLGIPVEWSDISGTRAIIESRNKNINAEPSQGSHFFHNLCSLGIPYLTIPPERKSDSFLDETWLEKQKAESETEFIKHIKLKSPLTIKANGKRAKAIILK